MTHWSWLSMVIPLFVLGAQAPEPNRARVLRGSVVAATGGPVARASGVDLFRSRLSFCLGGGRARGRHAGWLCAGRRVVKTKDLRLPKRKVPNRVHEERDRDRHEVAARPHERPNDVQHPDRYRK